VQHLRARRDRGAVDRVHGAAVGGAEGQVQSGTEELIAERGWSGVDAEAVWEMPTIFIGSAALIREDLQARRERFGLSYFITSDRDLPALAEIIGGL